ncbi:hypothetical protein PORY_000155 [Pneumocystis oryctolagi]|uniref:Uncharacterized protein n=1 Tax=Pneumocystis oryctolagi TaxID=42067 RepID=A0ACB7CEF7_9ASCO|nr:hypothetical protein PORY_000155 [Pneumocystis oryctolagi]
MHEYSVLEVRMPPTSFNSSCLPHYLYIKEHHRYQPAPLANQREDFPSERSLFISNLPVDTTHDHLKYLFNEFGARVLHVVFSSLKLSFKDVDTEDTEIISNNDFAWPVWKRFILCSGSWAIVEFLEKQDVQRILQNVNKKKLENYVWGQNIPAKRIPGLGFEHYNDHYHLMYPPHAKLQASIDEYMSMFYLEEEKRKMLRKRQRTEPDEEGFVTVTRGGRIGVGRVDAAAKIQEKNKNKGVLSNFYKFQTLEGKKKRLIELKKKFQEDQEKIRELREKKRFKMYP